VLDLDCNGTIFAIEEENVDSAIPCLAYMKGFASICGSKEVADPSLDLRGGHR
jgi:hypothetical protein